MKKLFLSSLIFVSLGAWGAKYQLESPDGHIKATVNAADRLTWSVERDGVTAFAPSELGLKLSDGSTVGTPASVRKTSRKSVSRMIASPFYRTDSIKEEYNELTLNLGKKWSVVFRAFNDGVAYRFVSAEKKPYNIVSETVEYNIPDDAMAAIPYVVSGKDGDFKSQFGNSFENTYTQAPLSQLNNDRLAFLPVVVERPEGVKLCITEADLVSYPGMYVNSTSPESSLRGVFAPYPKEVEAGGYIQWVVKEYEDYIARVDGPRSFPWRVAIVTASDSDLASSNLSYLLAEPSRLDDISWIHPGKVAWDWWNDWNIDGVDFQSGINNDTYKYYIDFASKNGIEYVILDDGWSDNANADLFKVNPDIDLPMLVKYARERNVSLILWAGYRAFDKDIEGVCRHYADMGIKGFKVDFMNRDDQEVSDFIYRSADIAARYNLVLDLHGMYKPAGMNRTYPNLLNFEGVFGLENLKWVSEDKDQTKYDVMIPFIRQVAGPLDYTQGAMLNGSIGNYRPSHSEPMSQGTRCHQLALYMIFDSPLNMLCDNPSNYMREQECTDFIADVPTVWDETRVLAASMGEYIVTARRKGSTWYVGGITDRTPRDLDIDLSFLSPGTHRAIMFTDGANAHRKGRDYRRSERDVNNTESLSLHLAPGGGFALRID